MQSPYNVQSFVDAAKLIGKIKHFANYSHEIVSALMVKKGYLKVLNWRRVLTHQQLVILKNLKLMACSVLRVFKATFKEKKNWNKDIWAHTWTVLNMGPVCTEGHALTKVCQPLCSSKELQKMLHASCGIYCCRLILIKHSQYIHYLQSIIPCFDCICCFPLWHGIIN